MSVIIDGVMTGMRRHGEMTGLASNCVRDFI
jgi:hypothetical protein